MKKIAVILMAMVFSFTTTIEAFPPLPEGLNIQAPDPSLPKELAGFLGKWEGNYGPRGIDFFLIVEKIDQEKAALLLSNGKGWERIVANVAREHGKWRVWFSGRYGQNVLSTRGKYLDWDTFGANVVLTKIS